MYQLVYFHFCVQSVSQLCSLFSIYVSSVLIFSHLASLSLSLSLYILPCITSFLLSCSLCLLHSFSLVILTFLLSPSLTLIRRGRYGSALWDWRKEGLIPWVCVCACVCVSSLVHACVHTLSSLVWNREILVWIYKRIQRCGVEFSFLSLQKEDTAARGKTGKVCLFLFTVVHFTPVTNTHPRWRKSVNDVWSPRLW